VRQSRRRRSKHPRRRRQVLAAVQELEERAKRSGLSSKNGTLSHYGHGIFALTHAPSAEIV
jgi:hypothetical protein